MDTINYSSNRRASGIPRIESTYSSTSDRLRNSLNKSVSFDSQGENDIARRILEPSPSSEPIFNHSSTKLVSSSSSSSSSFSTELRIQNLYKDVTAHTFDDVDVLNPNTSTKQNYINGDDAPLEQFYG